MARRTPILQTLSMSAASWRLTCKAGKIRQDGEECEKQNIRKYLEDEIL